MKYLLPFYIFFLSLFSCKQITFYDKVTAWPGDINIQSLDNNNGFKDLKLNHHISTLIQYLEKKNNADSNLAIIYQVKPALLAKFNIDEVKVKSIEAHFVKDLLFRFKVNFEGERNSFPFFLLLLEAYGGTEPADTRPETYEWNGNRVGLKYTVEPSRDATAEFTSIILKNMIAADKEKQNTEKWAASDID